jgi:Uma2 family endonuclease
MSIQPATSDAPFPATTAPLAIGVPPVRRFSVDEYHRMIETGILGENDRVELVDGWIIEMSPIGPPHATCVGLIVAALLDRLPLGWIVRSQDPITLLTSELEPDVTVARGAIRDYRDRHPGAGDIGLLIEVADASLQFDRVQKRAQYAMAGVAEYWIVNLVDRCVELHRTPATGDRGIDYRDRTIIRAEGEVELILDRQHVGSITVADILP